MATAPAQTFQDLAADPDIAAEVAAANIPVTGRVKRDLGAAVGGVIETLADVNTDSTKRNAMINNNNLMKGVIMGPDGPTISSMDLIVRPDTLLVEVDQNATIATTTVEAEFTEQLMESNYTAKSIKASAPYITANADYTQDTSYKSTATEKTVMVSSRYLFPQGRVDFNPPIVGAITPVQLSPTFTAAITAALGQTTTAAQREALDNVFFQFGHVFRTKVRLGGVLSAHTMETFKRTEDESTVKQDIKTSLEVAVKDWGLNATAGHGSTETSITTKQGKTIDVKYIVNGGDYTLIKQTDSWISSTSQSANWRVIEVVEVTPVVDMLPAATKAQVQKLMTPLFGQWVPTQAVTQATKAYPFSGVTMYRPQDPIPDGWFFVGYSVDESQGLLVKPALPGKTGRNVAVAPVKSDKAATPQAVPPTQGYQLLGNSMEPIDLSSSPTTKLGALRPGLFLEGNWKAVGDSYPTYYSWVIHPNTPQAQEDTCLDLQTVSWQWSDDGQIPNCRFALRKNAVLFDSSQS
ncbi:erylysin B [Lentinus tigrinus ALCF2SS1-6]|uniref:Erylysin B n=1 Tax=Lentinus tigrinus ALCF2SS1-6 TaxID=1328759 RepID=A0A5C2RS18_9APHY|nr:erylysin B [Lentinus tigrinus ALCF2SS1-6]